MAIAAICAPAPAALLAPGSIAENFFTSLTERPELGGGVIASKLLPITLRGNDGKAVYSFELLIEVIANPSSKGLSFSYRILNAPQQVLGIDRLDSSSFAGFSSDVAALIDGGGESAPPVALRSDDGARITFDFDDAASRISPGGNSFAFLVKTDALRFDNAGSIELLAFTARSSDFGSDPIAGGSASIAGFEPSASATIPLPPSAWIGLPTGAIVAHYLLRRQRPASA